MRSVSFTKVSFPVLTQAVYMFLKVVDEFHKKNKLKAHCAWAGHFPDFQYHHNKIKERKTATYPITGTNNIIRMESKPVTGFTFTFKGKFPDTSNDSSVSLNASHLKVLSISDLKDLEIPDPTPTPDPNSHRHRSR